MKLLWRLPEIVRALRSDRPSTVLFVISSPLNIVLLAMLALLAPSARTYIYLHEPGDLSEKSKRGLGWAWALALHMTQRLECLLATEAIVSSPRVQQIASKALRLPLSRIRVAPLILVDDGRPGVRKVPGSVLYAGRANSTRGIHEVLEAARLARDAGDPPRFMIATPDDLSEPLRAQGLASVDFLRLHHGRPLTDDEMASFYSQAEVVLLLYKDIVFQSGVPPMAIMHGALVLVTEVESVIDVVQITT